MKTIKYSFEFLNVSTDKEIDDIRSNVVLELKDKKINGEHLEITSIKEITRELEREKREKQPDYLKIVVGFKKEVFDDYKKFETKELMVKDVETVLKKVTGGKLISSKDISSES